ncbi:MAG: glycosyltransferase family 2 protein [Bacteroidaceae bacterium]|nr:glycosyltransferase family 2 protein [Bacteroidaceae bacterium]
MKLSVVIVNYNVKYFLEQCLRSACKAVCNVPSAEIIVVDNASSDGSMEYLKERFPDVTFVASGQNLGFARANNMAIRQSKGEYILLLNPDTIVAENTFAHFVEFMDSHPDVGACGAYMLHTDGTFALESRRGLPTPFVAFCKMSGLTSLFPKSRIFGKYYMRYLNEREANEIEIISGAYMFMRREALDKVGLLDEDFFMYGEDIDLSYRILKGGYRNYFLPSAILHYKGESTNKSSYRYVHTFYQAMQLFFKKHYSHYSFLVSLPISLAIWGRALLAYMGNIFRHNKVLKRVSLDCIVIGSTDTLKEVGGILSTRYGKGTHLFLQGDEASLPLGHLSGGVDLAKYNTVVYDTDAYSYESILNLLQKRPVKGLKLGTYSSATKRLITENAIYEPKEV